MNILHKYGIPVTEFGEALKEITLLYDIAAGQYPENMYEGKEFWNFCMSAEPNYRGCDLAETAELIKKCKEKGIKIGRE